MYYSDRQRGKRIFIIIVIIILIALVIYLALMSSFKREREIENGCTQFYERCSCIGILTGESIKISFMPEENYTYHCDGLQFCWEINETVCPSN